MHYIKNCSLIKILIYILWIKAGSCVTACSYGYAKSNYESLNILSVDHSVII